MASVENGTWGILLKGKDRGMAIAGVQIEGAKEKLCTRRFPNTQYLTITHPFQPTKNGPVYPVASTVDICAEPIAFSAVTGG